LIALSKSFNRELGIIQDEKGVISGILAVMTTSTFENENLIKNQKWIKIINKELFTLPFPFCGFS